VVVKPSDGNHARGVTLELPSRPTSRPRLHWPSPKARRDRRALHRRRGAPPAGGGRQGGGRRAGERVSVTGNGKATSRAGRSAQPDPRRGPEQEYPLDWINGTGAVSWNSSASM
jgi:cyanophycin synthetase